VKDTDDVRGLPIREGQHLTNGGDEAGGEVVRRGGGLRHPGGPGGGVGEGDVRKGAADVDGQGAPGIWVGRVALHRVHRFR
jgi:hypothetical protein